METQTQAPVQPKPIGFGQVIKDLPEEQTDSSPAESAAPEIQAAPATPAAETKAETPAETQSATPPNREVAGVLKGIQAERQKRQAAEERNRTLEAELQQYRGDVLPVQAPAVSSDVDRKLLTISEQSARAVHPDYDDKFKAFMEAGESNPALIELVMGSDNPGEAAYTAGKNALVQKKYGIDPEAMVKAVRAETERDLKERLRAEVEAEMKSKVQERQNNPTNILAGRAASGGSGEAVSPIGFGQILSRRRK